MQADQRGSAAGTPYRVLIVDDSPEIRLLVRTRVSMLPDVKIIGEASNGAEALVLVAALTPEVVVLDLEMPVMRGDAAVPKIRELSPGVRILLYTSAGPDTLDRISKANQPDVVVIKGGSLTELVDQLRRLLEMRPYHMLRVELGTLPLKHAVAAFDTWVGRNTRILESLERGDDLVSEQLGGATVAELHSLIGVYALLGERLQAAAREHAEDVALLIHVPRTTAAAARRALVAFDVGPQDSSCTALNYQPLTSEAAALSRMRDHLIDALPTSSADATDTAAGNTIVPSGDHAIHSDEPALEAVVEGLRSGPWSPTKSAC